MFHARTLALASLAILGGIALVILQKRGTVGDNRIAAIERTEGQ